MCTFLQLKAYFLLAKEKKNSSVLALNHNFERKFKAIISVEALAVG